MGGNYGHMSHLYDNPNLKFSTMMEIFKAAASGELEGTEKTDGQNLFVGYNVAEGVAKAVRNKSNLTGLYRVRNKETKKTEIVRKHAPGGLDASGLAKMFLDRGDLEVAFNEAFQSFEAVARSFSKSTQIEIFGDGVDMIVFFNAEIQDPRNPNVVNYDSQVLNIHRVGHEAIDPKTGELIKDDQGEMLNVNQNAIKLESYLVRLQKIISKQKFKVQVNQIRRLEALSDEEQLNYALNRLNRILDDAGISDNQTVGEYVVARLLPMIRKQANLPEDKESMLIKKLLGAKGTNIRIIKKDLDPEQLQAVNQIVSNDKEILQSVIQPLEDVVHDFSVEMIRNLQSLFILDQGPEVKRLKIATQEAIDDIEASGNEKAMAILKKQMEKLKSAENVTTAAEGFVFDYDGYTYKFTGNFAPMNQLLGLFEYGRGDIPPMKRRKLSEAEGDAIENVVAIYPGRFQPMGRHHAEAFRWLQSQFGEENVYIATSDKVNPPKSPLNFEEKKDAMLAHGIPESQIVQVRNPYKAEEILSSYDPETTAVAFMVGQKDMKGDPRFRVGEKKSGGATYFQEFESNIKNLRPFSEHGYLVVAPHISLDIAGYGEMCGTTCRAALADGDRQLFANVMGFFDEDLFNLFKEKFESGTLKEEVERMPLGIFLGLIEEVMLDEKKKKSKKQKKISRKIKFLKDKEGLTQKQAVGKALGMLGEEDELEEDKEGVSVPFIDTPDEPPNSKEVKELEEESGVSAVVGYSGGNENEGLIREGMEQMNRHEIYEEIRLRKIIREGIKKINQKIENEKKQEVLEEQRLRKSIRKMILQEGTTTGDSDPAPHKSTGINFLEKLLKNIIPTLEDDYKTLTTSKDQRESFRNHILKAIQDTIEPLKVTSQANSEVDITLAEQELEDVDLSVKVEDDPDFIDIRSDKEKADEEAELSDDPSTPEDEKEVFGIEGEDEVGRNAAFDTFNKISKQMVSAYDELTGSPEDQKLFYDYLLTNTKLYFDKFENDMSPVEEPSSPDYDPTQMDREAESAEVEPETIDQEAELGLGA